jgi:hypothetical protein
LAAERPAPVAALPTVCLSFGFYAGNIMTGNENNLIWIDLEMTGLDPERDRIIEIATLVTDAQSEHSGGRPGDRRTSV